MTKYENPQGLQVATNTLTRVEGIGTVAVSAKIGNAWEEVKLHNVMYIPNAANLFSQNVLLYNKKYTAESDCKGTKFYDKDGNLSLSAKLCENKMLVMYMKPLKESRKAMLAADGGHQMPSRWHERMGHVNFDYLKKTVNSGAVFLGDFDKLEKEYKCDVCIKAKATLKPYPTTRKQPRAVGELLHMDLVHAVEESAVEKNKYFLLIKDDRSNYRVVRFQKTKTAIETVNNIKEVIEKFSTQTGGKVKGIRSDKGTEFTNQLLADYLSQQGIRHEFTPTACPQSNVKIERDVRTVREMC